MVIERLPARMPLLQPLPPILDEPFNRPIISPLDLRREEACWKLSAAPMIPDAFAANPLLIARLPSARAIPQILLLFANSLSHDVSQKLENMKIYR